MSWDVMLIKTATNAEPVECMDDTNIIPFVASEAAKVLRDNFADIVGTSDDWLDYESDTFAISFDLSAEQHIMLCIHILDDPEDAVMPVIVNFSNAVHLTRLRRSFWIYRIYRRRKPNIPEVKAEWHRQKAAIAPQWMMKKSTHGRNLRKQKNTLKRR